jgi:hypothetical protein
MIKHYHESMTNFSWFSFMQGTTGAGQELDETKPTFSRGK